MYNGENLRWQQTFLAHGEARIAGIKKAIVTADQHNDYETMMFLRNDLCKESVFHSDNLDCIVTFPELIKLYDEHPDTGFSSRDLMWTFKYIVEDMLDFHQVSLSKCFELIEHFKERSLQFGFSLRTYYIQLTRLYAHIDPVKARESYENFKKHNRDTLSDCRACELNSQVQLETLFSDITSAFNLAQPILTGKLTCSEVPQHTYATFLNYFVCKNQYDDAKKYYDLLYKMVDGDINFLALIASLLRFCAKWDTDAGLACFANNAQLEIGNRDSCDAFLFCNGAYQLWNALAGKNETVCVQLPQNLPYYSSDNSYRCADIAAYYKQRALSFADLLDTRNGNNYYRLSVEQPDLAPDGWNLTPAFLT